MHRAGLDKRHLLADHVQHHRKRQIERARRSRPATRWRPPSDPARPRTGSRDSPARPWRPREGSCPGRRAPPAATHRSAARNSTGFTGSSDRIGKLYPAGPTTPGVHAPTKIRRKSRRRLNPPRRATATAGPSRADSRRIACPVADETEALGHRAAGLQMGDGRRTPLRPDGRPEDPVRPRPWWPGPSRLRRCRRRPPPSARPSRSATGPASASVACVDTGQRRLEPGRVADHAADVAVRGTRAPRSAIARPTRRSATRRWPGSRHGVRARRAPGGGQGHDGRAPAGGAGRPRGCSRGRSVP